MTGRSHAPTLSGVKTLFESIIPAQALGIEITAWDGSRIELTAPLAKNLNDKGTAFAGSIDSLLDLAGWSAITLALHDAGIEADVMIVKSETQYIAAVLSDMTATAKIHHADLERLIQELRQRGRSRISLTSHVEASNKCALSTGHYAILAKA